MVLLEFPITKIFGNYLLDDPKWIILEDPYIRNHKLFSQLEKKFLVFFIIFILGNVTIN
jgi:hypothetical protein